MGWEGACSGPLPNAEYLRLPNRLCSMAWQEACAGMDRDASQRRRVTSDTPLSGTRLGCRKARRWVPTLACVGRDSSTPVLRWARRAAGRTRRPRAALRRRGGAGRRRPWRPSQRRGCCLLCTPPQRGAARHMQGGDKDHRGSLPVSGRQGRSGWIIGRRCSTPHSRQRNAPRHAGSKEPCRPPQHGRPAQKPMGPPWKQSPQPARTTSGHGPPRA